MIQSVFFNSLEDLMEVVPGLSIDLTDAINTGLVNGTGAPFESNGISELSCITGRITDNFEYANAVSKMSGTAVSNVSLTSMGSSNVPSSTTNVP